MLVCEVRTLLVELLVAASCCVTNLFALSVYVGLSMTAYVLDNEQLFAGLL